MSFGPAIRSPGYGAPGRLRQGQLEIGGATVVAGSDVAAGGPYVAYAVRDWANIEFGADFLGGGWALGHLGGRFTYAPNRGRRFHGALDSEIGVGMGAGGYSDDDGSDTSCRACRWHERLAFGTYTGGGIGYHLYFFSFFARGRLQLSFADGLPTTLYAIAHGGIQFRIANHVDLHGSGGVFNVHAEDSDAGVAPYWDIGISVYFDVAKNSGNSRPK